MRKCLILFIVMGTVFLGGCNNDGPKESGISLIKTTNPTPVTIGKDTKKDKELVRSVEKDIEDFDELYDVAVIKGKEDILVAYKVKHMQRFHMKKIEKDINKRLEDKYPDENFIVSSDYKIFLEAVELEENMKDSNYSQKEAEKKLQEIIKLKKELT